MLRTPEGVYVSDTGIVLDCEYVASEYYVDYYSGEKRPVTRKSIRYSTITHDKIHSYIIRAANELSNFVDPAKIDICIACASTIEKQLLYLINKKSSEALTAFKVLVLYISGYKPKDILTLLNTDAERTIMKYYSIFIKKCPRNRVFKLRTFFKGIT
jgi:hypothetical protein